MKIEDIKVGEVYQFTNKVAPGSPQYPDGEVRVEEFEGSCILCNYVNDPVRSRYVKNWAPNADELSEIKPPAAKGSQ